MPRIVRALVALVFLTSLVAAASAAPEPAGNPQTDEEWRKHLTDAATQAGAAVIADDLPAVSRQPEEARRSHLLAPTATASQPRADAIGVVSLGPSASAAMTAALFFPGAGHFYVGGRAAERGFGFLLGEAATLGVAIYGLSDDGSSWNGVEARNPGVAAIALIALATLKIAELTDAGRSADAARANLLRPHPVGLTPPGQDDHSSTIPPSVRFDIAKF